MKRFDMFLDRLNHNDRPPQAQAPIGASSVAALISFVFIYWLDSQIVSSLKVWWEQLLVYGVVPMLLAFIILYRSSWHREIRAAARSPLLVLMSLVIFGGVLIALAAAMILLCVVHFAYGDISRFHY
ncbi:MAG: hypothetical protein P4M10_06085 [Verrucomicrobiae bacterium]|nr:hypothetical protein [Verrucomicrobiae bacterium]